jgi:hypothetical protein
MLNLELPFRLTVTTPASFFRSNRTEFPGTEQTEIILEGLSISIKAGARIYEVASVFSPGAGRGPSSGTAWTRSVWQVDDGISIEQQMAMPAGGDALAISWRSIGRPLFPSRFEVSPIFSAAEPFAETGFRFEPETNGGRLTWQPLENSSKIIADTNGRFDSIGSSSGAGVIPAAFEFTLSPQPAVLIFSSESPRQAGTDPLIGGFLAHLSSDPEATIEPNRLSNLAAA